MPRCCIPPLFTLIALAVIASPAYGQFRANPAAVTFPNSSNPTNPYAPQFITLFADNTSGSISFTYTVTTVNGGTWLSAAPIGNTTPAPVQVSVNTAGLASGFYSGSITFNGGGLTPDTVPVQLNVGSGTGGGAFSLSTSSLTFSYNIGDQSPAPQVVTLTSSTALSFTAAASVQSTSMNWLSVTPNSGGPAITSTLTVSALPTGLSAGTYFGTIPVSAGGSTQNISVTLVVNQSASSGGQFRANPASVTFPNSSNPTNPYAPQFITLFADNTSGSISFTYTVSTLNGGTWLSVAPIGNTTPAPIQVSVNTSGLASGFYSGSITFNGGGLTPYTIPVQLTMGSGTGGGGTFSLSTSSVTFNYSIGDQAPASQFVSVTSSTALSFTATPSVSNTSVNWLSANPQSGTTNSTLTIGASPIGLSAGTYFGTVQVSAGGTTQNVSVTLTVNQSGFTVAPTALSFTYTIGGNFPNFQTLSFTSISSLSFTTTASVQNSTIDWLSMSPQNGGPTNSASIFVGVTPNTLSAGTYFGTIQVAAGVRTQSISVTLTVSGAATGPSINSATPPNGTVSSNYSFAFAASSGTAPLTWTISSGTVPPGLSLANNGLLAGTPTAPGGFTFSVQVQDAGNLTARQTCVITIADSFRILTLALPGGSVNVAYNSAMQAAGGDAPYTWSHVGLPEGLTIDPATGVISGFPARADTFYATITVRDSASRTASKSLTVIIQRGASQSPRLSFVGMPPCRVMETRPEYNFQGNTGTFGPPFMAASETRTLTLPSSNVCHIPAASAYALNVTVVPRGSEDFVTIYPGDETRPEFWTVRSPDGQIVANSAIVRAGSGGTIKVFSSNNTDLLIDIVGYFTDANSSSSLAYYPLNPCRVIDTRIAYRSPAGPFGPPTLNARETRRFRVPSTPYCTVPTGASAYSVTITVAPTQTLAYLTAWPSGTEQPNISVINSFAGRILANNVIVPAAADGSIDVFAFDQTDLLVDINGYFAPDGGAKGLFYHPVVQCRVADSRDAAYSATFGGPIFGDETTRTIQILNSPRCVSLPASAEAYAINVTAIPNGSPMPYVTAFPTGQPRPIASILNAFQGQVVTNSAIIPSGVGGAIDVYAYRQTHIVIDLSGYFGR